MADYLVLARKYRSATFEEVVGQEHVAKTLQAAIRSGRIAHAFLFAGTRGVGKTTVARILAKALNCLSADAPTPTPCGKCDACQAIARGEDMDVIEIDGASNRGIDEIRELRSSAVYRPVRSRYRIYYIDEVHMLTREAFNALLKTLEEPPPHVKFIFATTEPEKLPATVISRCQRFDFRSISASEIRRHLQAICTAEKVAAEEAALARVARSAAGSMRDALSLLDQLLSSGGGKVTEQEVIDVLGQPSDERTAAVVAAIANSDPAKALAELEALLVGGMSLEGALAALAEMFRNLMLVLTCGPDSDLIELPEGPRQQAAELAKKFTLPAVVGAIGMCTSTARAIRGLSNARGLVEAAVVRMAGADKFVDAASLVERLGKLAAGAPGAPMPPRRPLGGPSAPGGPDSSGEQKKKILAAGEGEQSPAASPGDNQTTESAPGAKPKAEQGDAQAPPAGDVPDDVTIPWQVEQLPAQWPAVMQALVARRQASLVGLLAQARPQATPQGLLRLNYDINQEPVRRRAEQASAQVSQALSGVFGRQVRCEFVSSQQEGKPAPRNGGGPVLSTAQRDQLSKDPSVRAVVEFFDGAVANIVPAPAGQQEVPEE